MRVATEVPIAINFCGLELGNAFRADLTVEDGVIVELKAVERVLPLINFDVPRLMAGVRRLIAPQFAAPAEPIPDPLSLKPFPDSPASPVSRLHLLFSFKDHWERWAEA